MGNMPGSPTLIATEAPEHGATYLVWARALWLLLDVAERADLRVEGAFSGLPFDERSVRKRHRIAWDDYALVCERMTERAGGPDATETLLESAYHLVQPEFRYLAGAFVSPMTFARIVMDHAMPAMFQSCQFGFKSLGPRRARFSIVLRPGARPCLPWFQGFRGHLRSLPQHLGLEPAQVSGDVSERHGNYDILMPVSRSVPARLGRAYDRLTLRFIVGVDEAGNTIAAQFGNQADDDIEARTLELVGHWQLTTRQAEVLRWVAEGASNKEIAQALDCAENTIEFHVTQLLRRANVSSRMRLIASFWARGSTNTRS